MNPSPADEQRALAEKALSDNVAWSKSHGSDYKAWVEAVLGRLKIMPNWLSATWGGSAGVNPSKEGWGFNFEFVGWMEREILRLESENTKLRAALIPSTSTLLMCRDHFAQGDGMTSWAAMCIDQVKKNNTALAPQTKQSKDNTP